MMAPIGIALVLVFHPKVTQKGRFSLDDCLSLTIRHLYFAKTRQLERCQFVPSSLYSVAAVSNTSPIELTVFLLFIGKD